MIRKVILIASIITVIGFSLIISCFFISKVIQNEEYKITSINIYKGTPAWDLALAVKNQNISKIEKIVKEKPSLLNYQDPKYGATLLLWAIGMEKYNSAEILLKSGADHNIGTKNYGETPLFCAAGYSWIDNEAKKDSKYVKLLLSYGTNPNKNYIGIDAPGNKSVIEPGTSPLMNSIGTGIEKTKALVEAGADINYKTKRGKTAAIEALQTDRYPEYAYYLIVEKKAKVIESYFRRASYGNEDPNEKFFPVDLLRDWVFDLNSEEYKIKMKIVEEFARQGINYWDTKINKYTLEHIKKLYPDTWEEYIKNY